MIKLKKEHELVLSIIPILFLVASCFVPFASGLVFSNKYYGPAFSFIFGTGIRNGSIIYPSRGVSVVVLIAYLLLLISVCLLVTRLFLKKKMYVVRKILSIVSLIFVFSSAIMFLCSHFSVSSSFADALIRGHSDTVCKTVFENSKLCFGIYGVSIFEFVSSILLFVGIVL